MQKSLMTKNHAQNAATAFAFCISMAKKSLTNAPIWQKEA